MRDLIDREKLTIICYTDTEGREDTFDEGVRWVLEKIDEMPTVDAVPVIHGEWTEREVFDPDTLERYQSARCSVCKTYHTTPFLYYFKDYKFCPNCGAPMDLAERKEE